MAGFLNRFLPKQSDNSYQGSKVALWLFGFVALIKTAQGLTSMLNPYSVASSADGIPLSSYTPTASALMVSLFSLLGFLLALMGMLCIVVLVRYRSLVPFMFGVLAVHFVGNKIILAFHPIARVGPAMGVNINLALFCLMLIGLVLSLMPGRQSKYTGEKTRASFG